MLKKDLGSETHRRGGGMFSLTLHRNALIT